MSVLVFGEILWDIFGEKEELGGASMNFAAHLCLLGQEVSLVSKLGLDDLGKRALKQVKSYGIDDRFIGFTKDYPTGVCRVEIDSSGLPSYDLVYPVAYDFIDVDYRKLKKSYDAFYMGTLSRRNDHSAKTCRQILEKINFSQIVCDINIRQNYYSKEIIQESLEYATILKISRDEALVFTKSKDIEEMAISLSHDYDIENVIVTLDKDGAYLYNKSSDKSFYSKGKKVDVVSSVGAGDSFCACFLYNYLRGKSLQESMDKAVLLSSYVVGKLGAIPEYDKDLVFTLHHQE